MPDTAVKKLKGLQLGLMVARKRRENIRDAVQAI
jgi:hypothetical protein